jgi:hypothetical protein
MFRNIMIFIVGILMISLTGCDLKTPEIRGVVLDAETKQPVEGAWVTATLDVYTKTVGGDVHQSLFVGKTWTDKEGKFVIPPKEFKMPSFPMSFGSKLESLNVTARAISTKGYMSEGIGIKGAQKVSEILLHLKPPKNVENYRSALGGLYDFILTGKIGDAFPSIAKTERQEVVNIAIGAYRHYLEKMGEPKTKDQKSSYTAVMKDLGYLYSWKGDHENALYTFKKVMEFDRKRNMDLYIKEYEVCIKELEQKIQGK